MCSLNQRRVYPLYRIIKKLQKCEWKLPTNDKSFKNTTNKARSHNFIFRSYFIFYNSGIKAILFQQKRTKGHFIVFKNQHKMFARIRNISDCM